MDLSVPDIGSRIWGKTVEEETACPKRGIRQKILKTEELSETGARLGKPICAERYRRIRAEQGRALQSDWRRRRTKDQEEYRLAWNLQSPQWESLPDALGIELTRTGAGSIQTMGATQALEGFSVQVRLLSSATLALTEPPATPRR